MAPFVLVAFVALGRRFGAAVTLRRTACRAAAFLHGVHLAAVAVVVALEPPAAAFTYLFLARLGDTAPRIAAAPALFAPVLLILIAALAVRVWADIASLPVRSPRSRDVEAAQESFSAN